MRRLCLANPAVSAANQSIRTGISLPIRSCLLSLNTPHAISLGQFFTTLFKDLEVLIRRLVEGIRDGLTTSEYIRPMNDNYGKRTHPTQNNNECIDGPERPP